MLLKLKKDFSFYYKIVKKKKVKKKMVFYKHAVFWRKKGLPFAEFY